MTSLSTRRTVRESAAMVRSRGRAKNVVVELCPPGTDIVLRLKGERTRFRLPLSVVYAMAVQSEVQARKARRKAERAANTRLRQPAATRRLGKS